MLQACGTGFPGALGAKACCVSMGQLELLSLVPQIHSHQIHGEPESPFTYAPMLPLCSKRCRLRWLHDSVSFKSGESAALPRPWHGWSSCAGHDELCAISPGVWEQWRRRTAMDGAPRGAGHGTCNAMGLRVIMSAPCCALPNDVKARTDAGAGKIAVTRDRRSNA